MKTKGLTVTMVMLAESANYTEGFGNISVLKKMSRGDRSQYTYISRQTLRYSIVQQAEWDNTDVWMADTNTVQFTPAATIDCYPEIDLFGYMKTTPKGKKGNKDSKGDAKIRSAVARLSNAISLEPFKGDMDYLNNMGLARRINAANTIVQSEIHCSYYTYTLSIDLDKVGIDGEIEISADEKAKRVNILLETIENLYRDIKGRRENLAPIFAIGGVYDRKNPYFENRIKVENNVLNTKLIKEIKESNTDVKSNTICGVTSEMFANADAIKDELNARTISEMFNELKSKVREYYGC